jgi:hypothetical protein
MAATCVITEETYGSMKKIKWTWQVDSAAAQAAAASRQTSNAYNGAIERFVTIPDGSSAPAANYDVTILDQDSTDVLVAAGASRHSANTEQVLASSVGVVANDKLTISVANGGASGAGVAILYIR